MSSTLYIVSKSVFYTLYIVSKSVLYTLNRVLYTLSVLFEVDECNLAACPEQCTYGEWNAWGPCDLTPRTPIHAEVAVTISVFNDVHPY